LAWLIVPARGAVPKSVIEIVHQDAMAVKVEVSIGDSASRTISIPLDGLPDPEVLRTND